MKSLTLTAQEVKQETSFPELVSSVLAQPSGSLHAGLGITESGGGGEVVVERSRSSWNSKPKKCAVTTLKDACRSDTERSGCTLDGHTRSSPVPDGEVQTTTLTRETISAVKIQHEIRSSK